MLRRAASGGDWLERPPPRTLFTRTLFMYTRAPPWVGGG